MQGAARREMIPLSDLEGSGEAAVKRSLRSGATDAEAFVVGYREATAQLKGNDVFMGKSQLVWGLGLRVFLGCASGFVATNDLSSGSITDAAERAIALARRAPEDPWNGLPDTKPLSNIGGLYDSRSAEFEVSRALEIASEMLRSSSHADPRIRVESGGFTVVTGAKAVVSSRGVCASENASVFHGHLAGMAVGNSDVSGFDYEFRGTRKLSTDDFIGLGKRFGRRAVETLGAKRLERFKGDLMLEPFAVQEIISTALLHSVNSNNVQKDLSHFQGKRGEQVASSLLSVVDDGMIAGGLNSSTFDREGMPHAPVVLIEKGELRDFLYNTYTARREGRETSGHAGGGHRSPPNVSASNLLLRKGSARRSRLIDEMRQGMIVRHLAGGTDPISGDVSSTVKGGFYVEKGEKRYAVKEATVTGNVFDMLMRIDGVSTEVQDIDGQILPWIRIPDVSFTGGKR